jgi:hypothetical protein
MFAAAAAFFTGVEIAAVLFGGLTAVQHFSQRENAGGQ